MEFQEYVAKLFREAREKAGLTQAEVAKKAGISANYYARVERADPDASGSVINAIAKALKVELKLPLKEEKKK